MKQMNILLLLFLVVAGGTATSGSGASSLHKTAQHRLHFKHVEEWSQWKLKHTKSYESSLQELEHHLVWLSNKKYVDYHNANQHIFGYTLALNHLGDVTEKQYQDTYTCYSAASSIQRASIRVHETPPNFNASSYPDSMDWRTKGAVGSVKNQWYGQCDSCYAFSAVGALEGATALAKGYFVSLSEQNIIDCSIPYGNYGCSGGNHYNSFMYVIANDGIDKQSSYTYKGRQDSCSYSDNYRGSSQSGIVQIKSGDESSLLAAVYSMGPIAVAVDARSNAFKYYSSGVFDSSRCTSTNLAHSMLLTGYGAYQGKNYWLLKNSWGSQWGMSGYIMMTRNGYNQCGIATDASYPTL
uniref:Silicatein-like protein n=1 Tax=Aulosaccus sp. GV-2009 TaxID=668579 RepID=C8CBX8_9METZ|nr:silicatein-like protein [Aulosaccus sp. GV-2009]